MPDPAKVRILTALLFDKMGLDLGKYVELCAPQPAIPPLPGSDYVDREVGRTLSMNTGGSDLLSTTT